MEQSKRRNIRILLAKPGLDGHVVGFVQISRILRDAGFEVILGGVRQSPENIVNAAVEEDVDVVGLSILSGAHMTLVPRVIDLLREAGMEDVPVVVGGVVPPKDVERLKQAGIAAYLGPNTTITEVVQGVEEVVSRREQRSVPSPAPASSGQPGSGGAED